MKVPTKFLLTSVLTSAAISFAALPGVAQTENRLTEPAEFYYLLVTFLQTEPVSEGDKKALLLFFQMTDEQKLTYYENAHKFCNARRRGVSREHLIGKILASAEKTDENIREPLKSAGYATYVAATYSICPEFREQ